MQTKKNKKGGSRKTGNTKQAVALSRSKSYTQPRINDRSATFIRKSEYVMNLTPSADFQAYGIKLNPANVLMFPWLSSIANSWEKFRLKKLVFEYKTAQSTLVPGMVMMAPEYNSEAALPQTKMALLEYAYAKRGPIWENFVMPVPLDTLTFRDYYNWDSSEITEPLLHTPLMLVWATDAVNTDIDYIGELWVHYELEFMLPQTLPVEIQAYPFYQCISNFFGSQVAAATDPFTGTPTSIGGCGISVESNDSLYFQKPFKGSCVVGIFTTEAFPEYAAASVPTFVSSGVVQPELFVSGHGCAGWGWGTASSHIIIYGMNLTQEGGTTLQCNNFGCEFPLDPGINDSGNFAMMFRAGRHQVSFMANLADDLVKPSLVRFTKKERQKANPTVRVSTESVPRIIPGGGGERAKRSESINEIVDTLLQLKKNLDL
jgi:hypothetical protein